jgi:hypothetical protein
LATVPPLFTRRRSAHVAMNIHSIHSRLTHASNPSRQCVSGNPTPRLPHVISECSSGFIGAILSFRPAHPQSFQIAVSQPLIPGEASNFAFFSSVHFRVRSWPRPHAALRVTISRSFSGRSSSQNSNVIISP